MHTRTILQPCKTERRLVRSPRSRSRAAASGPAALTFAVSLSLGAVHPAMAGPKGGVVVGGQGTISTPTANTTVINQSSNQLQLNWSSFNVGASESVLFQQPSSTAVAFNRILDQSPSQIFGHIQGNGQVVLINPNGFLIGRTAQLNVNSLVVSSLDAIDFDASSGRYRFSSVSNPGAVINEGSITAGRGGSVTLLGGQVSNSGSIVADFGTVNLAAGRAATLDLAGDGLLRLEVNSQVLTNGSGAASAVENSGSIQATGGRVFLSASAVSDVFANLINNTGVVRANRIDNSGGTIELLGPGGEVISSGTLDASAGDDKSTGGSVSVLGEHVGLFGNAVVDVSGATGGGTALIGGDYHGSNPDVLNAQQTFVSSGATIDADAGATGNGGHVVVWADEFTLFGGNINARGGALSGDGGKVEVSGKQSLEFTGGADLTAAHGDVGTLLLDPTSLTIDSTTNDPPAANDGTYSFVEDIFTSATIGASVVSSLLATTNVTLQGIIFVNQTAGIDSYHSGNGPGHFSLTLETDGTMNLSGGIATNGGAIVLHADGNITLNGNLATHGGDVSVSWLNSGNGGTLHMAGGSSIDAQTGNITLTDLGTVDLGTLSGNAVSVTSVNGDITNVSQGGNPIVANTLSLTAGGFVGYGITGGAILTEVGRLDAAATSGGVYIDNQGDLGLGSIIAGGSVQLSASGAIVNSGTPAAIHGQDLTLIANTDIGTNVSQIATQVSSITASSQSGNIYIAQSGSADLLNVGTLGVGSTVSISAGSAGNVLAVHNVSAPNNGTVILSSYAIADDGNEATAIDAPTVNLTAPFGIGNGAPNAEIDIVGGKLQANSTSGGIYVRSQNAVTLDSVTTGPTGFIDITAALGDITIGTVSTNSVVTLNAQHAIVDDGDPNTVISAGSLSLTAGTGIGSALNPIGAATPSLSASVQVQAVTTNGDIYLTNRGNMTLSNVSTAGAAAVVDITTGNSSTLTVNSVSAVSNGTVKLTGGVIADDGNDSTVINAPTVELTASTGIGASGPGPDIDIAGGTLTANTNTGGVFIHSQGGVRLDDVTTGAGSIGVIANSGNISVGTVSAPSLTTLNAQSGGIANENTASLISTGGLTLSAATGIGTVASPLVAAATSLTATNTGIGSIYLANRGNLTLTSVNAAGTSGDVAISTSAANGQPGDLIVQFVNAPGSVNLDAAGAIADAAGASSYISGTTLDLTAGTAIGAVGANNQIGTSVGSVTATANQGGIYIGALNATALTSVTALQGSNDVVVTSAGDMAVGTVSASRNVSLTSNNGSITGNGSTMVSGGALALSASGSIGASGGAIATTADSLTALTGNGGIYIKETDGLIVNSAIASGIAGNIDITNLSGDLTLGTVSASGGVSLKSKTGALLDDGNGNTGISGNTGVTLQAATGIGTITDFATLAGSSLSVQTNSILAAAVASNTGQINLTIAGTPVIAPGAISLGSGSGRAGSVILQSAGDLNVAGLSAGAISIGSGNTTNVALSSGGVLTLPSTGGFTDAPAYSLLVHGATDVVDNDAAPRELSFNAAALNFQSGAAGGATVLDTSIARLDASIGNSQNLTVNQTGGMTLGAISVIGGNLSVIDSGSVDGDGVVSSPQISASGVTLSGTSLGAINAIYTQADTLNATASAGGIHVREADALTLTANATGGAVDVQTASGALTVAQASGVGVTLSTLGAGGNLVVSGPVSGGGGPVSLTASGTNSDIDVNAVVSSPGGVVTLAASSGAIVAGNGNSIVAGNLTATGSAIGDSTARLNTAVSTLTATATGTNGGVFVTDADALTLNALAANGPVDVQTTNGSLTVASATGNGVNLAAGGDSNFLTVSGALDGRAWNIGLTATGANSQINLNSTVTTSANVLLSASSGAIKSSGGHIFANALTVTGGSIGSSSAQLNTTVTSLTATSTGDIYAQDSDALQLAATAGGVVHVSTVNGALMVASATGNGVNLTAGGAGSNLNVDGVVNGGAGQVNLTAAGGIVADVGNMVAGSGAVLRAASIGSSGARLNTALDSLDAAATNGGIFVNEADSLTLTAAALSGAVDVRTMNGALTVASAAGDGVILGTNGDGAVLTINGGPGSGLQGRAGGVTLTTSGAGSDVALNGSVVTTGNIAVAASGGAVVAGANGNLSGSAVTVTGTSIGTSTARVNTTTASLNATSTNGGIFINELDGLALTGSATGGVLDVQAGGPLVVNSASGDGVTLIATPVSASISVNGPVDGGSGPVMLAATGAGGTINLNGAVTTLGDATLVAGSTTGRGAITTTAGSQITAASLTATGSAIGTSANPLNTAVAALSTTSTNGDTFVDQAGALTLAASAIGGGVNVQTSNGSLVVNGASGSGVALTAGGPNNTITLNGLVAGGTGGVTLTAGSTANRGAIFEGSGGSVTGGTLTAVGSSIGSIPAPLATNIDILNADATGGGVYVGEQNGLTLASVQAAGDVNVSSASGNIKVASVTASGNATLISASGAITDDQDNSTLLSAHTVTLLAQSIGDPSTLTASSLDEKPRLDISANTLNATSTAGGIYIDAVNGLAIASVHASGGVNGNIELLAPNGDLNLLAVSATNTLLLSAGRNILGLPGLGEITARSAELRAGGSDPTAGHIGTLLQPLTLQLDPGSTLRIFVPQTVSSNDPTRAPATLPSAGVLTTLSLFSAPSPLSVEAGYGQFTGLSDSLYTSQAESLVHSIQNQTAVVQTVLGLDWSSFDPNVSLFGTLDPSVCLPSDQRDEETGKPGC